jgi:hypothetical protein
MTADLYWREPLWLLALAHPVWVAGLGRWRKRRQIEAYADRHLLAWVQAPRHRERLTRRSLLLLAFSLCAIGMAGPRLALQVPADARAPAGALVVLLDLSRSMEARDLGHSRRAAALRAVRSVVTAPQRPPIGIVVLAGRAHTYAPPTTDEGVLNAFLAQASALRLPTLGNDVAGGMALAQGLLREVTGPRGVLLLTDGDVGEAARTRAIRAAAELAADDIGLTVVGVGTPLPTAIPDPERGWITHDDRPVVSRLETAWLRHLAESANGRYRELPATATLPLSAFWSAPAPRIAAGAADSVLWRELFPWLLVPGIVLLVVSAGLPARGVTPLIVLALLLPGWVPASRAAATAEETAAHAALVGRDYAGARDRYRSVVGFAGRYGEGVACYRLGDYGCAIDALSAAAWLAAEDDERARAAYSLAAAFYQLGDYAQAAALYRDARANGLARADVEHNLALSDALAAQVERHRREAAITHARRGKASRGELPPELADREAAGRTLTHEENPPPLPPGMDRRRFDELVARGVERARLAVNGGDAATTQPSRWFGREDAVVEIPGALLWQRLFEIEEGFLVSPERPRPRPEEQAW